MPSETATLPHEIATRLGGARTRLRAVAFSLATERAALALIGAVILSFALDKGLEPEIGLMRPFTFFLLVSALAAGGAAFAFAFRRRLTDDTVAVLVERAFPELEDGLVSSVQLARDLDQGGLGHTSPALIRSTITRTAHKARHLDFDRVVDASPLLAPAFLLLAAVFGIGLFALEPATQPLASTWWQRCVLGHDVQYPKSVALAVSVANERDFETAVARGDDVTAEITVTRGVGHVRQLVVRTYPLKRETNGKLVKVRGRPEETRIATSSEKEAHYRKIFQNVTEPFTFVVDAGDHVVSQEHRVLVVDRPRVEEAKFWLTFPEYTGIAATPREKPETQADLRVPVGTEIEYQVTCNKSLADADLVFELEPQKGEKAAPRAASGTDAEKAPAPPVEEKTAPKPPKPLIAGDGKLARRVLTGKFRVDRSLRFRYALVSTEGYDDGKKPVVFSVLAVVDRPPDVKVLVPGRPKQVTPRALVPLEVEVKDDYGVASAEVRFKVELMGGSGGPEPGKNTGGSGAGADEKFPLPGLEDGTKLQVLKYRWDLAELGLHPLDRITYRACAYDRDIDESKRLGESASFLLQVVSPEDLSRILMDRLQRVKDELLATAKLQHQAKEDAEKMVQALAPKTRFDEEDKRRLNLADTEQRQVTSRLASIASELDHLVEERELNRLGDERELDREKELRDMGKDLAERASPLVSRELEDARRAPELDERTKVRLAQVPDLEDKVEQAILALATRIEKWADFADIIRDVRDILSEQERITSGTEDAVKENQGGEKK
jgi:hypothetical protein